jgi:hypothetical protein
VGVLVGAFLERTAICGSLSFGDCREAVQAD